MNNIPKLSLLGEVENTSFDHAVFLTYGIDLPFFEDSIIRALLRQGTHNIAVFADRKHVAQQMRHLSEMRRAREKWNHCGKVYSLTGVHHHTAFHPKVALLVAEDEVQLWVGSGNLETGGIRSNLEIHNVVKTDASGENNPDACLLISQAWKYIRNVASTTGAKVVTGQLDQIEDALPWLQGKVKGASGAYSLVLGPEDDAVKAIVRAVDGEKVDRLVVLSPFFDKDFRTLKTLEAQLKPKKLQVLIQADQTSMDGGAAAKLPDVEFYELEAPSERYAHAKVLLVECRKKEILFSGSHNLSERGMGAENYEASLLRIGDKPGEMLSRLRLEQDLVAANRISKSDLADISIIVRQVKEGSIGPSLLESAEYSGDTLILRLRREIKGKKVSLLAYVDAAVPKKYSCLIHFDKLTASVKIPKEDIYIWSALAIDVDGKASAPVPILHTVDLTTRATRNRKLRDLAEKATHIGPDMGAIDDLIEDFRSGFFDDWRPAKARGRSTGTDPNDSKDPAPKQLSYEDFIIPLEEASAGEEKNHGDMSRSVSDTVLGVILRSLGGTKVTLGGEKASDASIDAPPDDLSGLSDAPNEEEEAQALQAGKMEGARKEDDGAVGGSSPLDAKQPFPPKRALTSEEESDLANGYVKKFKKMVEGVPDRLEARFDGDRPLSISELETILTAARFFTGLVARKQTFGRYDVEYLSWNAWAEAQAGLLDVLTTSRLKVLKRLPWKRAGHGALRDLNEGLAGWCLSVWGYVGSPDIEEEPKLWLRVGLRLAGQLLGIDQGVLNKKAIIKYAEWILGHRAPGAPDPVLDLDGWVSEVRSLRKADDKLRKTFPTAQDVIRAEAGVQQPRKGMWVWWPGVENHVGLVFDAYGDKIDLVYEICEEKSVVAKYTVQTGQLPMP